MEYDLKEQIELTLQFLYYCIQCPEDVNEEEVYHELDLLYNLFYTRMEKKPLYN